MISRRQFTQAASRSALALLAPTPSSAQTKALRLGGPIFLKSDDPAELAREHRRLGYSAAYCPPVKLAESEKLVAIYKAFATQNVVIAEVGAWVNMLEADATKRKQNLNYVIERLAIADVIGARNCVNIGGSFNPQQWDGPDPRNVTKEYFDATVENCRKVIDAVKPKQTKFTIEMMGWSLPDSPDAYVKLYQAIDRPGFGVHVDICNIINSPERFYRSNELIQDTFRKLGKWVCSCHAKDLAGKNVHFIETIPGRGGVDYRAYLKSLVKYSPDAPLMLEHLSKPEEYEEGKQYILHIANELNIPLA